MLCALFRSHLLLAMPTKGLSKFEIVAVTNLSSMQMDRVENGKGKQTRDIEWSGHQLTMSGLQCHTAPFSWKIMFQSNQQWYELILCACSAREEEEWKKTISQLIADENQRALSESSMTSVLKNEQSIVSLDIQSMGPVFALSGNHLRQGSIQRAGTVTSDCRQVVIKNTHLPKDVHDLNMTVSESLNRSKSSPSATHVAILAPKRIERYKIEQVMANVWTRDRLPYPSMASHRGEYFKNSASTVMRKLSKASTATTSTLNSPRRSVSYTSIAESSPYYVNVGGSRIVQYDGSAEPTPRPRNCVTPTPEPRKSISFGTMAMRSSMGGPGLVDREEDKMTYVTKLRKSSEGGPHLASREDSRASTVVADASRDSIELERVGGTVRKPKTLLKAFSTEGIRGWFH